ncbi:MAG: dienelactone hydrolase family protein [Gammaproteobacteria bacterium]
MNSVLESIEIDPPGPVRGAVIWLHGLGADGHDFEPLIRQWDLVQQHGIRFVLPHAPVRPVTMNGGMEMRAWYDLAGIDALAPEDAAGIQSSREQLEALIRQENDRGIPSSAIVLAGFSQGGAMVLHTGLRYRQPLAGILALSCYLPLAESLEDEKSSEQKAVPLRMDHGDSDPVVPLKLAHLSRDAIQKSGYSVEFNTYPMAHSLCPEQAASLYQWLRMRFPLVS